MYGAHRWPRGADTSWNGWFRRTSVKDLAVPTWWLLGITLANWLKPNSTPPSPMTHSSRFAEEAGLTLCTPNVCNRPLHSHNLRNAGRHTVSPASGLCCSGLSPGPSLWTGDPCVPCSLWLENNMHLASDLLASRVEVLNYLGNLCPAFLPTAPQRQSVLAEHCTEAACFHPVHHQQHCKDGH